MSHRSLYNQHAAWCEEKLRIEANQRAARLEEENEKLKKELETLKEKNDSISNSSERQK
jgi:hypothetical protein